MDYVDLIFTHPFLLLWLGQIVHILKKVKEVEDRARSVTLTKYIQRHRYGVAFSVVAGLAAYAMLHQMGELSAISAFMAGYMSESIINSAATRVTRRVSGDEYGFYQPDMNNDPYGESQRDEEYYEYYSDGNKAKPNGD